MANAPEGRDRARGESRDGRDRRKGASGKPTADAVPVGRIEERSVQVFRGDGVEVRKESKINVSARVEASRNYVVTFAGHPPIPFARLKEAMERAREKAPEAPDVSSGTDQVEVAAA